MRRKAVEALTALGPKAKGVVPGLAEALKYADVRVQALQALTAMGADAQEAVPALTAAAKDRDLTFAKMAGELLKKLEPTKTEPKKVDPKKK